MLGIPYPRSRSRSVIAVFAQEEESTFSKVRRAANGWYMEGRFGSYLSEDIDFSTSAGSAGTAEMEPGYSGSIAIGRRFGGIALEAEGGWTSSTIKGATWTKLSGVSDDQIGAANASADLDGSMSAYGMMLNGWYHLDDLVGAIDSGFSAYVGGGVGFQQVSVDYDLSIGGTPRTGLDDDTLMFKYQLGAGANMEVFEGISLGVDYRYIINTEGEFEYEDGDTLNTDSHGAHYIGGNVKVSF